MAKDNDLRRVLARLERKRFGRYSDLYRWLRSNHAELSAYIAAYQPTWLDIAQALAAEGLTGARGQPLAPKALRQMWQRVCRDVVAPRTPAGDAEAAAAARPHPASAPPSPARLSPPCANAAPGSPATPPVPPAARLPVNGDGKITNIPAPEEASRRSFLLLKRTLAERSGRNPDDVT